MAQLKRGSTVDGYEIIHRGNVTTTGFQGIEEKGQADGYAGLDSSAKVPKLQLPSDIIYSGEKGIANGVATLDGTGRIPTSQIPTNFKEIKVVNNIAERDALEKYESLRVHVKDASGDSSVENGGWAEYIWDGSAWTKTAEKDSIDVVTNWSDIQGKPSTLMHTTGATMNNELKFNYVDKGTTATINAIKIKQNNDNINVWNIINSNDTETFGYRLLYRGQNGGNDNTLELWGDNTDQANKLAYKIWQNGNIDFGQKASVQGNEIFHAGNVNPLDKDMTTGQAINSNLTIGGGARVLTLGDSTNWGKIEAPTKLYLQYDNPTKPIDIGKSGNKLNVKIYGDLKVYEYISCDKSVIADGFKANSNSTDYSHFIRNGGSPVVYFNQLHNSDIAVFSQGTSVANQGIVAKVGSDGSYTSTGGINADNGFKTQEWEIKKNATRGSLDFCFVG